jgi:hypothetical protein
MGSGLAPPSCATAKCSEAAEQQQTIWINLINSSSLYAQGTVTITGTTSGDGFGILAENSSSLFFSNPILTIENNPETASISAAVRALPYTAPAPAGPRGEWKFARRNCCLSAFNGHSLRPVCHRSEQRAKRSIRRWWIFPANRRSNVVGMLPIPPCA